MIGPAPIAKLRPMIAQVNPSNSLSPEEYLILEEQSDIKHEYRRGQAYAMAGTTDRHNVILGNVFVLLRTHLRGSGCKTYFTDIKAEIPQDSDYYYPDLMVTCNPQDNETSTYKRFPKLIIEILSDSTEAFDRGDKFSDYQTIKSLEEYVLINTKRQRIEVFRRAAGGLWILQTYHLDDEGNGSFEFKSVGLTGTIASIYDDAN
jgi:Uma2 family endonuclease